MRNNYYKINPEIRDFILKEAGECPQLGCRKLSGLIRDKFGLEVSKSSISAILKAGGLNKPVGRRGSGQKPVSLGPQIPAQGPSIGLSLLAVEEKQLLTKIEREVSLVPRIIQDDKLPLALRDENRQIVNKITDEPSTSLRAGRAQSTERDPPELSPYLGCWFLKAGELCLGGLQAFSALLSSGLKEPVEELSAKNEALLYLPILGVEEIADVNNSWGEALVAIIGRRYSAKDIQAHLESLKQLESANLGLFVQESLEQKEVLGLKFILEDDTSFFMDGSARSIWSKNHIPLEFSQGLSKVRDYLTNAIIQDSFPLIGQTLPGFAAPTPALLNFIVAFSGQKSDQAIKRIELYDNEDKIIESLEPIALKRHYFILGVWPWQYPDRSLFVKEGLRLIGGSTTLTTGCPKDTKEILAILTNLPENEWDDQRVISLYLERWPNLEAGCQDFLDKIGHYFEIKKTCFLSEKSRIAMPEGGNLDINQILGSWRMKLNSFCQRHFFPLKYADADFSLFQERFYNLPGIVKAGEKVMEIIFPLTQGFLYPDDLAYACQRVNEADIRLWDGRRLRLLSK